MAEEPTSEERDNFVAGAFVPALRGARFARTSAGEPGWAQSGPEDVSAALVAAEAAAPGWNALAPARRLAGVLSMARALEADLALDQRFAARFGLAPSAFEVHRAGLEATLVRELVRQPAAEVGVTLVASEWRELVRAPLVDVGRELARGRCVLLVSDARLPETSARLALAARAAELPRGVLGLLHGPTRELLTLALAGAGRTLVASGLVERMVELRRLCAERGFADPRLRALRCGVHEVEPGRALEECAREVVGRAFGPAGTLSGQLPGALGRVYCPARSFSRFTELVLAELESSPATRAPARPIDEGAVARVRAAWELGLDEGATCIAGGALDPATSELRPTLFTNVETYMACARRQDPMPVLCLLRAP
jgi:acyl-CoA reductase-like NAD-dependent aldehyde dehydrogenase